MQLPIFSSKRTPLEFLLVPLGLLLAISACGPAGDSGGGSDDGGADDIEGIEEVRSSKKRITSPQVSGNTVQQLTGDNAGFAFDLYEKISNEKSGENFFYSPHSISSALAMTYAGAENSSESQMKQALRFELPENKLHPAFNQLDLTLEKRAKQSGDNEEGSPFKLEIANSIWGQQGYPFKDPFLDTLAKHYGAGLRAVDFQNKPEPARKSINKWVEKKTEGRIEKLLPQGSINPLTRLVLTNAIYFKASWAHEFDESRTSKASFTTASGSQVQADMMKLREKNGLSYANGQQWKAVELPYVGGKVSMVVLVPDKGAFPAIEGKLSGTWLRQAFGKLQGQAMQLQMPKFEFDTKFFASEMLQALGMQDPFDANAADFTDIADAEKLFLRDVIHQSFVSVDEEGTEAAAATAVTAGTTSAPQYETLTVDRPFIFVIRDRETNAVIFAGRVVDPTQ